MVTIPVYDADGKNTGTIEFDEKSLGGIVKKKLLKEAVLMYEANQRQGTVRTQTRSETTGSGKKMYKQKGTGQARMGAKRTHKRRGGGTQFGPFPRDFSYTIGKSAKRAALKTAFLGKLLDKQVYAIENLGFTKPKTKDLAKILDKLKIAKTCLIGLDAPNESVLLSARNLGRVDVLPVKDLNAYCVAKPDRILLTRQAANWLKQNLAN